MKMPLSLAEKMDCCVTSPPINTGWYELDEFEYEHTSPFHAVSACHGKLYVLGGTYRWLAGGNSVERYDPLLNR